MANGRQDNLLKLREQGLSPLVKGAPTVGPTLPNANPTVNVDPLGAGAQGFSDRMQEIRDFTATNPELQYQRASALASRGTNDPEVRAQNLRAITAQQMAQQGQERLAAIQTGAAPFTTMATGQGGFVVDKRSGAVTPVGGGQAQDFKAIEQASDHLATLYKERSIALDNAQPTEALDKRIALAQRRYDALTGTPDVGTTREMSGDDQRALAWANQNPTDPRAAQIKARLGVQ